MASSTSSSSSNAVVHPNIKGVFVGSGSDGMAEKEVTEAILDLAAAAANKKPNVLYLGTATYDLSQFCTRQTQGFEKSGCSVKSLDLADAEVSEKDLQRAVEGADIVVVGGGNTLFAVDRWNRLGLNRYLKEQAELGNILLTGGSAGAICWFAAGHSDSMDPDSYKSAMLNKCKGSNTDRDVDESTRLDEHDVKEWNYIRVPGLGLIPGILCPHYDRIQSNGVLRADDFDAMLVRQAHLGGESSEVGIGIDHWAALVLEGGGSYRVLSLANKPGSVLADGTFSRDGMGIPGIWIKTVEGEKVISRACPPSGNLADILNGVVYDLPDDCDEMRLIEECRKANPDDGPGLASS